jgi:OOP family OmpA-OmpF porin
MAQSISTFLVVVTEASVFRSPAAAFPKRRTMKKLNKVAMLFASAALATAAGAQVKAADGGNVDNWQNGTGELVWKNGTNELCWRDANWTPATAAVGCDGAQAAQGRACCPGCCSRPGRCPAPAAAPAPVAAQKVTFAADAFFDFDKAVLKPEGRPSWTTWSARSRASTWK